MMVSALVGLVLFLFLDAGGVQKGANAQQQQPAIPKNLCIANQKLDQTGCEWLLQQW